MGRECEDMVDNLGSLVTISDWNDKSESCCTRMTGAFAVHRWMIA
jgi:hypothetical protein